MEIITFFSFKGGVGRTQSLLNTACEFAQRGKNVLLIDFDLHAPGLSLMECMRPHEAAAAIPRPGALDFFEWLVLLDEALRRGEPSPAPINLAACAYAPEIASKLRDGAGFLKLVPAAGLSSDCADAKAYSDRVHTIDSPLTEVIRRTHRNRERNPVIEQIRSQFSDLPEAERPDAIFIDARTGITGIADLLLTRSSDRIVLVTGLNQQNLWGLESTLQDIERSVETADWLRRITIVISPVPLGEHELTEKRTKAITATLNRHVDPREREMFGEIGLLPEPIQIPYDAQLALLEDPILLRHENSIPAVRYRELADRLGGKIEPLQFKAAETDVLPRSNSGEDPPQEHPLARVLPWNAGLTPEAAQQVLESLGTDSQPDKPHSGWIHHALNYLANSEAFAGPEVNGRLTRIQSLPSLSVAQRISLLQNFRRERQYLFSAPKSEWHHMAHVLGTERVAWLDDLPGPKGKKALNWQSLFDSPSSASLWGGYWTGLAEALRRRGHGDEALKLHQERLALYEASGDKRSRAITLGYIARIHADKGELDAALKLHQEALAVHEAFGDKRLRAVTLGDIARILMVKGEVDAALKLHEERLVIFEALGDKRSRAVSLGDIARILKAKGKVDEALKLHQEKLAICEDLGDKRSRAFTLGDIARILTDNGEMDAALKLHQEELAVYEALGDKRSRAVTLGAIARILMDKGEVDAALKLHQEKLAICEALGDKRSRAISLGDIADIRAAKGELDPALKLHEERLVIFEALGDLEGKAQTLWSVAKIEMQQQHWQAAYDKLAESYALNLQLGRLEGICFVGLDLGQLLHAAGQRKEGLEILERSLAGFQQMGWHQQVQDTQKILDALPDA